MIFDKVVGHGKITEKLLKALRFEGRTAHALLFSGPSGVGKKMVALAWAQGLLCQAPNRPCGKCSSCIRVEKGNHPDLMAVTNLESANIKIDQVRTIEHFISLKSFEGHAKVVVIDEAHTMTAQAANALLKTLEEPPAGSFFVLVTSNRGAIPITIQSRCQKVLFGALSDKELKKIVPDVEDWVARLAQGRVDTALRFADESYKKLRKAALLTLKELPHARAYEGFTQVAELTEDRDSALFAAQCWHQWIKKAASSRLGVKDDEDAGAQDEKTVASVLAKHFAVEALLELGQKVQRLEQDIQGNINKNLAFEKFWIDAHSMMLQGAPK
jgi:DNA polymerase III subunit delta'